MAEDGRQWRGSVRQVLPVPHPDSTDAAGRAIPPPAVGAKAVFYTVLFDVPNPDRALLPRMSAQVAFVTRRVEHAVLAPLAALRPTAGQGGLGLDADAGRTYRVRVLEDGRAVERVVRIGARDRRAAEILDGLKEGELLILGERASGGGMSRFVL